MKTLIARLFGITTAPDAIMQRDVAFQVGRILAGELDAAEQRIRQLEAAQRKPLRHANGRFRAYQRGGEA